MHASALSDTNPRNTAAPDTEPLWILVIDNDDVERERIIRLLRGYPKPIHITEAESKSAALHALQATQIQFTFAFVDLVLEDGDGRDLLPTIREMAGPDCVVVAVTGYGTERIAADTIKLGMNDYIAKSALTRDKIQTTIEDGLRWRGFRMELRKAEAEILHRSLHDALTGLPNRHLFFDRLSQSCALFRRDGVPFAVMMIDLDRFKEINDQLGHAAGDYLLFNAASRLTKTVRESDTVARLGGDEFALLLHGVDTQDAAIAVGEKVLQQLQEPLPYESDALRIGASLGIALCPTHGTEGDRLLHCADKAMYRAKRGIDKVVTFDASMLENNSFISRASLLGELEQALERDEIDWYWQPKVNLQTGSLIGFEAFVHWHHPKRGTIPREHFIDIVAESPLLAPFTQYCLERVLAQMATIHGDLSDLPVSINISPRLFERKSFIDDLLMFIDRYQVPRGHIILELSEATLVSDPAKTKNMIEALHHYGIDVSIDGFGADFTSFNSLRDFAVHEIKIDKSYIINLCDNLFNISLVSSLTVFCKQLGLRLVADSIETQECCEKLLEIGCLYGQGTAISPAMPFDRVRDWSDTWLLTHPIAAQISPGIDAETQT